MISQRPDALNPKPCAADVLQSAGPQCDAAESGGVRDRELQRPHEGLYHGRESLLPLQVRHFLLENLTSPG